MDRFPYKMNDVSLGGTEGRGIMTTILLADSYPLVLRGLRALLAEEPDFEVLGEATDGLTALQMIERLKPDVAVVDLMMSGLRGLEITKLAVERSPSTRVMILSGHANEEYVVDALHNGASGYVLKDTADSELVRGIREVVRGRRYLSLVLSDRALDAYLGTAASDKPGMGDTLTAREREVLQLAAEGLTNGEIAARLTISPLMAETHRARVMHKLGLRSQADLVRYAMRQGIAPPE